MYPNPVSRLRVEPAVQISKTQSPGLSHESVLVRFALIAVLPKPSSDGLAFYVVYCSVSSDSF